VLEYCVNGAGRSLVAESCSRGPSCARPGGQRASDVFLAAWSFFTSNRIKQGAERVPAEPWRHMSCERPMALRWPEGSVAAWAVTGPWRDRHCRPWRAEVATSPRAGSTNAVAGPDGSERFCSLVPGAGRACDQDPHVGEKPQSTALRLGDQSADSPVSDKPKVMCGSPAARSRPAVRAHPFGFRLLGSAESREFRKPVRQGLGFCTRG